LPVPSAADELAARQRALGRPLRFDEYLDIALYGAHGFYSVVGSAGRRGDFLTSPEVGPLFGAVVARWIDAEWRRLGEPVDFTVIEVGAGPGTLARSVLLADPRWQGRYVAVERSAAQRERHPEGVRSTDRLPDEPVVGVVVANEVLDNVPFRLAVFDGSWREAFVDVAADGTLREVTNAAPPEWSWLPVGASHGARVPVQHDATELVRASMAVLDAGSVLMFDYCTPVTAALAAVPWREWLRTYRGHERGEHYLRSVGSQDITAQVCLDQLPEPWAVRTQEQFLRRWDIDELVDEGRRVWAESAAAPSLAALRMRSRVREAESLLDSSGLGGFLALEWRLPFESA
jgi:SAM-dependent MidA family methyltransferase